MPFRRAPNCATAPSMSYVWSPLSPRTVIIALRFFWSQELLIDPYDFFVPLPKHVAVCLKKLTLFLRNHLLTQLILFLIEFHLIEFLLLFQLKDNNALTRLNRLTEFSDLHFEGRVSNRRRTSQISNCSGLGEIAAVLDG